MNNTFKIIFLLSVCLLVSAENFSKLPPATLQTLPEMMADLKYPLETHFITTSDGYILQYFRIQKKNQESIISGLPVLFFQHGLEDSSDLACLNNEYRAPALMFANQGYDVWLGNSRGNRYSKNHTTLSVNSTKFWRFSFQDMGMYDLPAAFTYIAAATGQKINYVGHSQGTTQMFVALSRREKAVEQNLKSFIALGPATFVGHIRSKFMRELAHAKKVIESLIVLKVNQFLPYTDETLMPLLCQAIPSLCGLSLEVMMDLEPKYDNLLRMDIVSGHIPAGTSTWNIRHWGQNIRSGKFRYFDHGKFLNYLHYGQSTPPDIALDKIRVPVHLFAGATDELADLEDVAILRQSMTKSPNVTYNEYPFGHASFLIAKDMSYINDVLAVLETYNPEMKKIDMEKIIDA